MVYLHPLEPEDWPEVAAIYQAGIASGHATFETTVPSWEDWDNNHLKHSRIIALIEDTAAGWAALSPVSKRHVYRGVAEVSVYIDDRFLGQGLGTTLLHQLILSSEEQGIWTLQSSIFPENTARHRLHLSCGFREVGRRENISQMHGRWRDTLILERRSNVGLA